MASSVKPAPFGNGIGRQVDGRLAVGPAVNLDGSSPLSSRPPNGTPDRGAERLSWSSIRTRISFARAPERPMPDVYIYADESCLGNGRKGASPGGAAGLV